MVNWKKGWIECLATGINITVRYTINSQIVKNNSNIIHSAQPSDWGKNRVKIVFDYFKQ